MGGSMRLGTYPCKVVEGTKGYEAYGEELIYERHRHRFEVNNAYRERLTEAGLVISGLSPDGKLVEMVELPGPPVVPRQSGPSRVQEPPHAAGAALPRLHRRGRGVQERPPRSDASERRAPPRRPFSTWCASTARRAPRARVRGTAPHALTAAGCDGPLRRQRRGDRLGHRQPDRDPTGHAPGTLALSAHMDCVEPCRGVEPRRRSTGVISLGRGDRARCRRQGRTCRRDRGHPRPGRVRRGRTPRSRPSSRCRRRSAFAAPSS